MTSAPPRWDLASFFPSVESPEFAASLAAFSSRVGAGVDNATFHPFMWAVKPQARLATSLAEGVPEDLVEHPR